MTSYTFGIQNFTYFTEIRKQNALIEVISLQKCFTFYLYDKFHLKTSLNYFL